MCCGCAVFVVIVTVAVVASSLVLCLVGLRYIHQKDDDEYRKGVCIDCDRLLLDCVQCCGVSDCVQFAGES